MGAKHNQAALEYANLHATFYHFLLGIEHFLTTKRHQKVLTQLV